MIYGLQFIDPGDEDLLIFLEKMVVAILIGLLMGIERERDRGVDEKTFAGVRTFPLISLFGFLSAFIASFTVIWVFVAAIFIYGLLVAISYYFSASKGHYGSTSETSYLLSFILGSLVFWGHILIAAILAVVITTFLSSKSYLRKFAGKVEKEDIYATLKFALITIIILPLLPDRTFGPFDVLNPSKIWIMVVLISGLSFTGYILFKIVGTEKGILLLSLLGGLASSTAATLSLTQRSKDVPALSKNLAGGIILASSIMFPRVLIIIFLLNSELGISLLMPFGIFMITGFIVSFILIHYSKKSATNEIKLSNPFYVMTALKFGLVFGLILFATGAAQHYLGEDGIFYAGLLGGLVNFDAVALSMSDMAASSVQLTVASTAVLLASMTNTIVKMIIASTLGARDLRKYSLYGFSPLLVVIIVVILIIIL